MWTIAGILVILQLGCERQLSDCVINIIANFMYGIRHPGRSNQTKSNQ